MIWLHLGTATASTWLLHMFVYFDGLEVVLCVGVRVCGCVGPGDWRFVTANGVARTPNLVLEEEERYMGVANRRTSGSRCLFVCLFEGETDMDERLVGWFGTGKQERLALYPPLAFAPSCEQVVVLAWLLRCIRNGIIHYITLHGWALGWDREGITGLDRLSLGGLIAWDGRLETDTDRAVGLGRWDQTHVP
ncbi:uncharacterized protein BCR38DRAFT_422219 [Pseudomassariella vexata]|uniref:Uncharacterized protein n=1 Tax=Pseudomassariella vexata TaxID=1141098 RepID=A0A1Y2EGV7_9PEZI|nr:uncharacterized protein BCR38DRAFT_422219 [Pseudomassariella vexata]ORY70486.1 hypothetical protein BCR38DRAFT_422219 [Pseudomassariella vexata]